MDIKDLLEYAKNEPAYKVKRKVNSFVLHHSKFNNLDRKNREQLAKITDKYAQKIKKGYGISSATVRRDMYRLHSNREKLDLTREDLDDFRDILNEFRS